MVSWFIGLPFVKRFALCYRTIVLSVCPVYNVGVLWRNGWMDQDATWYGGRAWPGPHCVRWGPSAPMERGTAAPPPLFGPCLLWPNGYPSQQLLSCCLLSLTVALVEHDAHECHSSCAILHPVFDCYIDRYICLVQS